VTAEATRDLPRAVGAEVEVEADVAVANRRHRLAAIVCDHERHNELIGNTAVVRILYTLHRLGVAAGFAVAEDHRVEGFLFTVPLLVAVHGVVAPANGRN